MQVGDKQVEYGYSRGIYTRYVSALTPIKSVPAQEEIDALGGGKTSRDWDARFELAYQKCRDLNVTLVGGVAPTATLFGRYLRRVHGVYPKDIWKTQIMTLGSVPGINTRYVPALHGLYGPVAIREIYGATEGMFGQQRDEQQGLGAQLRPVLLRGGDRRHGQDAPRDAPRRDGQPGGQHARSCRATASAT